VQQLIKLSLVIFVGKSDQPPATVCLAVYNAVYDGYACTSFTAHSSCY